MDYKINVREESFGGTVSIVETGKRAYVNKEELKKILKEKIDKANELLNNFNRKKNENMEEQVRD